MKRLSVFAAVAMHLAPVQACPVADALIRDYGISFSGFDKQIPRVARPGVHGVRTDALVVVRLPNKKGTVPDGFLHAAFIDQSGKRAWIRRTGGFVPVNEWYGPVKLGTTDLKACVTAPYD